MGLSCHFSLKPINSLWEHLLEHLLKLEKIGIGMLCHLWMTIDDQSIDMFSSPELPGGGVKAACSVKDHALPLESWLSGHLDRPTGSFKHSNGTFMEIYGAFIGNLLKFMGHLWKFMGNSWEIH